MRNLLEYLGRRWTFYVSLVFILVMGTLLIDSYNTYPPAAALPVKETAVQGVVAPESPVESSTDEVAAVALSQPAQQLTPAPAIPSCAPGTPISPEALRISTGQPGVQQVVDPPQFYQVFGYNGSDIQQQIQQCSPVRHNGQTYAANTAYTINWTFLVTQTGAVCTFRNVAVGVHIMQLYPAWSETPHTLPGYADRWHTFMKHLMEHEDGHRDLALRYAYLIFNDLQTMPPHDCNTVVQTGHGIANARVAQLNELNATYDATTGHGVTQGATIPR